MTEINPVYLRLSKFHDLEVCHGSIEGAELYYPAAAYEALQTEVTRLQREVVNRNQRALDGDKAIKTQDALLVEVEALQKELNQVKEESQKSILNLRTAMDLQNKRDDQTLREANAVHIGQWRQLWDEKEQLENTLVIQAKRIAALEQAASINQEYVTEMHRINDMAITAGLKVPIPNSPYYSERSAIAYLQRQSYEQGWSDGNSNVKLMDHKD